MARYIIVFLKQSLKTFEETANLCFLLGKVFLEISQNSQENICVSLFLMYQSLFFFPVNFAKYIRTPFYSTEHLWETASVSDKIFRYNPQFSFLCNLICLNPLSASVALI